MTYETFQRLCHEATEYDDIELYIAERGWQEWMAAYNGDAERIALTLNLIYSMARGGFSSIRAASGLSQVKFAAKYGITRRAVEAWDSGVRTPPDYTTRLLAFAVCSDLTQDEL